MRWNNCCIYKSKIKYLYDHRYCTVTGIKKFASWLIISFVVLLCMINANYKVHDQIKHTTYNKQHNIIISKTISYDVHSLWVNITNSLDIDSIVSFAVTWKNALGLLPPQSTSRWLAMASKKPSIPTESLIKSLELAIAWKKHADLRKSFFLWENNLEFFEIE